MDELREEFPYDEIMVGPSINVLGRTAGPGKAGHNSPGGAGGRKDKAGSQAA